MALKKISTIMFLAFSMWHGVKVEATCVASVPNVSCDVPDNRVYIHGFGSGGGAYWGGLKLKNQSNFPVSCFMSGFLTSSDVQPDSKTVPVCHSARIVIPANTVGQIGTLATATLDSLKADGIFCGGWGSPTYPWGPTTNNPLTLTCVNKIGGATMVKKIWWANYNPTVNPPEQGQSGLYTWMCSDD